MGPRRCVDKNSTENIDHADVRVLGRLVGLLGSLDADESDGFVSPWMIGGLSVTYPWGDSPVEWIPSYLTWAHTLATAMDAISQRLGLEPGHLPCVHQDDPEAAPVMALRDQMWRNLVREIDGDEADPDGADVDGGALV